jgi:uncharacterized protein (DUF3084 family)
MQTIQHAGAALGPDRLRLKTEQIRAFQASLVLDPRRRRPLYFDGRFLAARDLVAEQNYFLTRQADLGRAGGFGVVEGLYVDQGDSPSSLVVTAGHGVTPGGELVVLPEDFTVELTDVAEIQRLNAAFGLLEIPKEPGRNRTGLFVVALRPVEFSANPIASYPTNITAQRGTEDGEIVEGAVVTLIPYPDEGPELSPALRRARVAHEVFVGGTAKGTAAGALPLALVALNGGRVEWVDVFLVRREVGASQSDVVGLGFAPRALREAHLLQYEGHLREVLEVRQALGQRFAASDYFQALPPAGRLPAAAIDPRDFSQIWFPSTVDVDLSLVPEDEIPALVEESLTLQPIDLTRPADELDSTSILVLVPVPRNELRTLTSGIASLSRSLKAAAPGMLSRRQPLEHLRGLRLPGAFIPQAEPPQAEDAAWQRLLARGGLLWYVRRRALHHRADLAGERELLRSLQAPGSDAAELNRLKDELNAKDAAVRSRDQQVRAREEEVAKREEAANADTGARDAALKKRAEEVARRELALNQREEEVRDLERAVTSREGDVRRREDSVGGTDADVRQREAVLLTREMEMRKRADELAGRELTAQARLTDVQNREAVLRNQDAAMAQREKAVAERETRIGQRATELDQRNAQQEARQAQLNTLAAQLDHRVAQLNQREAALNARQAQLDQKQNEQSTRTSFLDARTRELDARANELNGRSAQLSQLDAQLGQRHAGLNTREAQLNQREITIERREQTRINKPWMFEP